MFCFVPFLIILQSLCINIYAQSDEDLDKLLEEDTTVPQAQLQDPSFQNNTPVGESDFLKSGETLYTPPVILKKKRNIKDYSLLEKETPKSKFDKDGFFKSRYWNIKKINEVEYKKDMYSGGYVCLGDNAGFLGKIVASGKKSSPFHEGDELEMEFSIFRPCVAGEKYISMDKDTIGVYKITGVLEIVDKALKDKRCVARVKEIYDVVKRGSYFTLPIQFEPSDIVSENAMQIGKIYKMHSQRVMASVGERLCVLFKDQLAPKAGTIVYFYDTKDPVTGHEVTPYMVAKGKLIYSYSSYGTAVIMAADRPVTKNLVVTTRF